MNSVVFVWISGALWVMKLVLVYVFGFLKSISSDILNACGTAIKFVFLRTISCKVVFYISSTSFDGYVFSYQNLSPSLNRLKVSATIAAPTSPKFPPGSESSEIIPIHKSKRYG